MNRRDLLKGALRSTIVAVPALPLLAHAEGAKCNKPAGGPGAHRIPNFSVIDQSGQKALFYDDLIKGKIVTLNFFYTGCDELCPRMTGNLRKLQELLGDRMGRDIFMYSITLDPEHDTPQALRAYADKYGAAKGWKFLTGSPSEIEILRHKLGFYDSDPVVDRDKTAHAGVLRYGNEAMDRWGACPGMSNPVEIVKYISWLEVVKQGKGLKSPAHLQISQSVPVHD